MKPAAEAIEEIRAIWREALRDTDPLPMMARVLIVLGPVVMLLMLGGLLDWWDLGGTATDFDTACWLFITALGTAAAIVTLRHTRNR
jgi:hypothetical protein